MSKPEPSPLDITLQHADRGMFALQLNDAIRDLVTKVRDCNGKGKIAVEFSFEAAGGSKIEMTVKLKTTEPVPSRASAQPRQFVLLGRRRREPVPQRPQPAPAPDAGPTPRRRKVTRGKPHP